jgi:hypothetical protein
MKLIKNKCCICDKIKIAGEYTEIKDKPIKEFYDTFFTYSHGYCPPCLNDQKNDITRRKYYFDNEDMFYQVMNTGSLK